MQDQHSKNAQLVVCQICDMKILKPGFGKHVDREISLPVSIDSVETVSGFWRVEDMFHFENIGFLRASTAQPNRKYLTCAGCEKGVLGVHLLDENAILLAQANVNYI